MTTKLDGKALARKLQEELKVKVTQLKQDGIQPCLAVILVGNDSASQVYVRNKKKVAQKLGIKTIDKQLPQTVNESELIDLVTELNQDENIHGILVQLPLPESIDEDLVMRAIDPAKDVDGFHPFNIGKLFMNKGQIVPCTPKGIMRLLAEYQINLDGKKVVIVGRSKIVGMPLIALMLNANATVTVAHSHTKNLKEITRDADIVITAIGQAEFFDMQYFNSDAIIIDVGTNRNEAGKLVGDVKRDAVMDHVAYLSPVPGGVGPMTITMLMEQTIQFAEERESKCNEKNI